MLRLYSGILVISLLAFVVTFKIFGLIIGTGVGILILVFLSMFIAWLAIDDVPRLALGLLGDGPEAKFRRKAAKVRAQAVKAKVRAKSWGDWFIARATKKANALEEKAKRFEQRIKS